MNRAERVVDGRHLLAYDQDGQGRVVEAFGDLDDADRIAVFVPGAGWNLDNFADTGDPMSPRRAARTFLAEAQAQEPEADLAAIAWLGYFPPDGLEPEALRSDRAIAGAGELVESVRTLSEDARVTLICHSYGSVLCGRAAPDVDATDIVVVGGAGMDASTVKALDTSAQVWAARADGDGMRFLPDFRIAGFGHGAEPAAPGFGAEVFSTGIARGHSSYYQPGGETMRNIARIVLGDDQEVTRVAARS